MSRIVAVAVARISKYQNTQKFSTFFSSSSPACGDGAIASFGFTQEQVACVCEVLEQSGNIDRLAR